MRSPAAISFGRAIYGLTEPLLAPIRSALRPYMGNAPIDFSVFILYLILQVARTFLLRAL
jgi:YggT family protein